MQVVAEAQAMQSAVQTVLPQVLEVESNQYPSVHTEQSYRRVVSQVLQLLDPLTQLATQVLVVVFLE